MLQLNNFLTHKQFKEEKKTTNFTLQFHFNELTRRLLNGNLVKYSVFEDEEKGWVLSAAYFSDSQTQDGVTFIIVTIYKEYKLDNSFPYKRFEPK